MVRFNVEKFCDLQGHFDDLPFKLQIIFAAIFGAIGVVIVVFNSYVIFKGAIQNKTLRFRRNIFVLSLILSDLCFGLVFIPLFVVELLEGYHTAPDAICNVRSWRVLAFTYLFSTRLLSILFISINTYIKTCKQKTKLDSLFNQSARVIILVLWMVTLIVLIIVAICDIEAGKTLGTITYTYFFVSITGILACYITAYVTIKRAQKRANSHWYDEAIDFVKGILVWFLVTTIPVAICGLLLLILAHDHHIKDSYQFLEHHVYLVALSISTLDAIANPIVYLRKFKEFRDFRLTMQTRTEVDGNDYRDDDGIEHNDNVTFVTSTLNINDIKKAKANELIHIKRSEDDIKDYKSNCNVV